MLRSADALSFPGWIQSGIFLHGFVETAKHKPLHEPELAQPVWAGRSSRADQYSSVVVRALEAIFTLWSCCQYFRTPAH